MDDLEETPEEATEDEGLLVPLEDSKPAPVDEGPSDAVNLVPLLRAMLDKKGKPFLESMAETCLADYDADVESRRERMKKIDEFEKLKASVVKSKSFPFQNAATVNLPFLAYVVLQTHARLYDMVYPASGKIMICSPTNVKDVPRAQACETFGNSYIRHDMPSFGPGMDVTLMQCCTDGSAFRRTNWNSYIGKVDPEAIPIADFVVGYWEKCDDPSLRGVPRYTHVLHKTIFDLEDYAAQGIYDQAQVDKLDAGDAEQKTDSEQLRETIKKQDGVRPSDQSSDDDKPRMVLDQYRRWRMPNKPGVHASFDGKAHYVTVTIDERSRKVLRVVVREEDDPADVPRFEKEQAAVDQHTQALTQYASDIEGYPIAVAAMQAQGQPPPEPPVPPMASPDLDLDETGMPLAPKPPRQRELCFFTHYKCFPGEGFYGLGFGDFIAPLNKAANTLLNQRLDLGTLQNAPPGFISRQLRGARGSVGTQPGKLEEVDAPLGVIKDGIYWMDVPQGDPRTMDLIQLLQSMVEKFGGSDILSGEVPKSNNTATGMTILNEQAMAPITVLSRRIKDAERHELEKIWRCWGTFLPEDQIADVVDENGEPGSIPISRAMFRPDARVMPVSDTRMKSQRAQESTALYQMGMQDPVIAQSPPAMQMLRENMLRALDANNVIPLIAPPPPQPPPPPVPSWHEDANFLRGQDQPVHPMDDDAKHINEHEAFKGTPAGLAMEPTAAKMHDQHIRNHRAAHLEKTAQSHEQMIAMAQQQGAPQEAA